MRHKIKRHANEMFHIGDSYKEEFRYQLRLVIVMTFAFTIAFAWRQTVFDIIQSIVATLFQPDSEYSSTIITSVMITIISLFLIFITSKLLKKPHYII